MRIPRIVSSIDKAKSLALELFKSEDWRCNLMAIYYLKFYMKPREIMKFLDVRPVVIRNGLAALMRIRREPKLIKCSSIKEILEHKFENKAAYRRRTE